jgi:hypothetical protein
MDIVVWLRSVSRAIRASNSPKFGGGLGKMSPWRRLRETWEKAVRRCIASKPIPPHPMAAWGL